MIGLFAIIAHNGSTIRYYCTYYCTYFFSYYGTWVPIIRYYSLLLFAIIVYYFSYYSQLWQCVGTWKMGMCMQQFLTQSWRND
jgi:hypothetical protein